MEAANDRAFDIPERDEDLLAQCRVSTFRGHGPGGQSVNTTDSAVRIRHLPTGIVVTCRRERSQYLNKKTCVARLRDRLEALAAVPEERVPTKPPRAAHERVLATKKRRSAVKRARKRVDTAEE